MCVSARRGGASLHQVLTRRHPHYPQDAEDPMFVQDLLTQLLPLEGALRSTDQVSIHLCPYVGRNNRS